MAVLVCVFFTLWHKCAKGLLLNFTYSFTLHPQSCPSCITSWMNALIFLCGPLLLCNVFVMSAALYCATYAPYTDANMCFPAWVCVHKRDKRTDSGLGCNVIQGVVLKRKDSTGGWGGLWEPPNTNILLCGVGMFCLLLSVCKYKQRAVLLP